VIHLEAKTAYLATLLAEAGATVVAASSNTGSTNDSVCAALVRRGIEVHALHGASQEEQEADLLAVADTAPELIVDDGAILANTGATDDEFDMTKLRGRALEARMVRPNVEEFRLDDDRSVLVVGDGKVVNLSAGEGHPIEIMDLTFSVQALSARCLLLNADKLEPRVHVLPPDIDEEIARNKLEALGLRIDSLTGEQHQFLHSWGVPA
jgi:S-adenosylhomocysteine hydrolase